MTPLLLGLWLAGLVAVVAWRAIVTRRPAQLDEPDYSAPDPYVVSLLEGRRDG